MKHTVIGHPKTARLKRMLGLPLWQVVGILESVWQLTAAYADDGDLGRWTDDEIASWLEYEGDAPSLMVALTECRFLTEDRHVHDWDDHCPDFVRKRRQRRTSSGHVRTTAATGGQRQTLAANGRPTDTDTHTIGMVDRSTLDHRDVLVDGAERELGPPPTTADMNFLRKAATLALTSYSEDWWCDSLHGTQLAMMSKKPPAKPYAYFRKCLDNKAKDAGNDFAADLRRVK